MSKYRIDKSNWPNSDTTEGKYYEIGYKDAEDKLVPLLEEKGVLLSECRELFKVLLLGIPEDHSAERKIKELLNRLNKLA